jgi:hypothetical protein
MVTCFPRRACKVAGAADAAYQKKVNGWGLREDNVARMCKERIFRIAYHPTTVKRLVFTGDKVRRRLPAPTSILFTSKQVNSGAHEASCE